MKLPKQPLDPQAKLLSLHYSSDLYFGDLLVILTTQSTIFFKSVVTLTKLEFSANKTSYFIIDIKTEPQLFFKYLRQRCKRLKLSNNFSFGLLPPCHFLLSCHCNMHIFLLFYTSCTVALQIVQEPSTRVGHPFFSKERNDLCVLFRSL